MRRLRKRACMQMECSEDAIKIDRICSENSGFLHKQLENQNIFEELHFKSMHRKFGRKTG